ncbi:2723_t:CDS:1 [Ambispora leptoticha]|uniref:2723_t:CDS:1 n=1 Tax=Ambispora leptoticha TaxID=144679 RepID=A0A9N8VTX4_9GLOM|nr:2723_t:CDS:1 [Ambispora leptoticha]
MGKPTKQKKPRDQIRQKNNEKKIVHQRHSATTFEYKKQIELFREKLNLFPVPFKISDIYDVNDKNMFIKDSKVKRPSNSFILFRLVAKKLIKNATLSNSEGSFFASLEQPMVSKIVGALWKQATKEEKKSYEELAEELKQLHMLHHPDYKYKPKRDKAIWKLKPQVDNMETSSGPNGNEINFNENESNFNEKNSAIDLSENDEIVNPGEFNYDESVITPNDEFNFRGNDIFNHNYVSELQFNEYNDNLIPNTRNIIDEPNLDSSSQIYFNNNFSFDPSLCFPSNN